MTFKDILGGPKRLISDPGRVLNWQAQMATEASRHHGGGSDDNSFTRECQWLV